MTIDVRDAGVEDIPVLVNLYRQLEKEMVALHAMWPTADGLDEPIAESMAAIVEDTKSLLLIVDLDGYPFGFLWARSEDLLTQAGGEKVGAIRLIYVEDEAREVALGEALREEALARLRAEGLTKFDAHVLPGHRLAKNFFESGGFSARSIIMHHDDERE